MTSRQVQLACSGVVVTSLTVLAAFSAPLAHPRESQVTWTTDIEPILKARCVGCHTTGGFGSMALDSYEDARQWAGAIREEVLEGRMPPWPAARGFGDYRNDRSLSPLEVDLLVAWAGGGTPLGPPVPAAADPGIARPLRAPDLVLTGPAAQPVTAPVVRVELPTGLRSDRWITGWEFRPGNRTILQQAVITSVPGTVLGTWTPPDGALAYPSGVAYRLAAGSRLVLELHYRRSATPQTDHSALALYFGRRPKRELQHRELTCGVQSLDRDIEVLAVTPRARAAGAAIEIVAARPDQTVEPLAVVPRYQPPYPVTYRFRNGVRLAAGSVLNVRSSTPECGARLEFVGR